MNLGVKNDFPVYLSDPCGYIRARDSIHTAKTFKICLNFFFYILCFSVSRLLATFPDTFGCIHMLYHCLNCFELNDKYLNIFYSFFFWQITQKTSKCRSDTWLMLVIYKIFIFFYLLPSNFFNAYQGKTQAFLPQCTHVKYLSARIYF